MNLHLLPGDAYVSEFKKSGIEGEVRVCRECLVEGDLSGESLDEFFRNRAAFINDGDHEGADAYDAQVGSEFRRLLDLPAGTEVNLWFEYELFCAVNMWFCCDLLATTAADVYRVAPIHLLTEKRWDGFGLATADEMRRCFESRTKFGHEDVRLGAGLWRAYKAGDRAALRSLSEASSEVFPYLREVCDAAIAKDSRPKEIIREIQAEGHSDFRQIFPEFRRRAGVYGYGDTQVQRLIMELAQ
jgi:hypothetical protein